MPQRGDNIDERYELTAALDDRGLGECWRARDARVKNRTLMLRFLRALPDQATTPPAALKAHTDNLRQLRHPSILTVHEAGVWRTQPYLVHDLFEGPSLGAGLDKARAAGAVLSITTIELFFDRIMTAVEVAHLQATPIAHGVLGPGRVFVQRLPGASFDVRVTDFGMLPWSDAPVLREGSTRGLVWMAPECALTETPTRAVDLYQLGRLLELMLTSPTSADGFHEEAPRALADVIAKASHTDPTQRFETVKEFRDAFRRALAKPVAVEAPRPAVRASTMVAPMPARPVVRAQTQAAPMPERPALALAPAPVRAGTQVAPMPERTSVSFAPPEDVETPASPKAAPTPAPTSEIAMFAMEGPRWGSQEVHIATAFMMRPPEVAALATPATSFYGEGFVTGATTTPHAATQVAVHGALPAVPPLAGVSAVAPPQVEHMTGVVQLGEALVVASFNDSMNPWDTDQHLPFHEGLAAQASEYVPTTVHVPPPVVMMPGAAMVPITNVHPTASDDRSIIVKTAVFGVLGGVVLLVLVVGAWFALR